MNSNPSLAQIQLLTRIKIDVNKLSGIGLGFVLETHGTCSLTLFFTVINTQNKPTSAK